MTTARITDKKLKNQRFRKTEESILKAYLAVCETLSLQRLIKEAHISRSTLYRHHKNLYEIVPDYERYISTRFTKFIKRLTRFKILSLKDIYEQTFIFIIKHRMIIGFLAQCGNRGATEELLYHLEPAILATGKVAGGEMFKVYIKEVAALIEEWEKKDFRKEDIPATVNKILYLTDNAQVRLGPLADFDASTDTTKSAKTR